MVFAPPRGTNPHHMFFTRFWIGKTPIPKHCSDFHRALKSSSGTKNHCTILIGSPCTDWSARSIRNWAGSVRSQSAICPKIKSIVEATGKPIHISKIKWKPMKQLQKTSEHKENPPTSACEMGFPFSLSF